MRKLPTRVYEKHGAFYFVTLERRWIRLGKTKAEMYQKLAVMEGEVRYGTMDALISRYLSEVTPGKAEASRKKDQQHAKALRDWCGLESPLNITPADVARYLRKATMKVQANRQKALLSHIFTMAMEWGDLTTNPCKGVRRNPEKPRTRYPEDWEVMTVWKHASQRLRWLMALAYMTGQRQGDLLSLKESSLRKEGLFFEQAKTGARLIVEYSPSLRIVLTQMAAARRELIVRPLDCPLFHGRHGKPWKGAATEWQRVMLKLGLNPRFHFHDLRAKSESDSSGTGRLGHLSDTARRVYQRLPKKVKPV